MAAKKEDGSERLTRGSLLAANVIWNFLGFALPLIIGLATIPFLIRNLGNAHKILSLY